MSEQASNPPAEPQVAVVDVLLVDDDEFCLNQISRSLRQSGVHVVVATNGQEALNQLGSCRPEVIISDVMMPGMNGYELCRQVRRRGMDDIPFLFVSALGNPRERVVGLRMGADDYIVKPVDLEELRLKVKRLLKKAGRLREFRELAEKKLSSPE